MTAKTFRDTPTPLMLYHARLGLGGAGPAPARGLPDREQCAMLRDRGFNAVLIPAPWRLPANPSCAAALDADHAAGEDGAPPRMTQWLALAARQTSAAGLALYVDVLLDRVARNAVPSTAGAGWYQPLHDHPARDPRLPSEAQDTLHLRPGPPPPGFVDAWTGRLRQWADSGVKGFAFHRPQCLPAAAWKALGQALKQGHPDVMTLAWTPGLTPAALAALRGAGFDGVFSSLPWWDYKAAWLAEEDARLRAVAAVIAAPPETPDGAPATDRRALWSAALCGDGVMISQDTAEPPGEPPDMQAIASWIARTRPRGPLRMLGGRDNRGTLLLRDAAHSAAVGLVLNPSANTDARLDWDALAPLLPPGHIDTDDAPSDIALRGDTLPPGGAALFTLAAALPVREPAGHHKPRLEGGANLRIAIENVSPAVDGGAFPVKCIAHERITVQADIFMDGHDVLAAEVRWRALDESHWQTVALERGVNDRWEAAFRPRRIGAHEFMIHAWHDDWQTFHHEFEVKHRAGTDVRVEAIEGVALLRHAAARAGPAPALAAVQRALKPFPEADADTPATAAPSSATPLSTAQINALLAPQLSDAMRALGERSFETVSPAPYPLWVDRSQACHASWYELFPRSQADTPGKHGTFTDVIRRLPDVRDMGFDVLYFPPIHPIGQRNRKGRNNSLRAEPDDVGSPYAIGSRHGGHAAIEPLLGTLPDFLHLVDAARDHGMEIALDFAIQCSPDHPWLAQHPDWFQWRPDGSLRYAENPPKKYEDIVNVYFYGSTARRARKLPLWRALRDVVLFWAEHGVRIFRVDNPHTKPLPFWQWMIAEVHALHPDVIFLSEAFTRPKMMYRLAKIGFTQSYTYFTWRNERAELQAYLEEVSQAPVADFFRPHFFVNTPDINPVFLQTSGRPGFLIRAALAALGAGLWGMYSGFELCEAAALPGKEEYLDSEKYEVRQRDWHAPGNIRAEISRLNQIRRANPALQTHRGFTAMPSGNDRVLAFIKSTPGHGNVVLAAISLDPHHAQDARIEAPFWLFGQPDAGRLVAEDLLADHSETWRETTRAVTLTPDQPYRVWRLSLHG